MPEVKSLKSIVSKSRKDHCRRFPLSLGYLLTMLVLASLPARSPAQGTKGFTLLSYEKAEAFARQHHPVFHTAALKIKAAEAGKQGILDFKATQFLYQYGQLNSTASDPYFEIIQNFGSPLTHTQKSKYVRAVIAQTETETELEKQSVIRELKSRYYEWLYAYFRMAVFRNQLELYEDFKRIAELKYTYGELSQVEKSLAVSRVAEIHHSYHQAAGNFEIATNRLKQMIQKDEDFIPPHDSLPLLDFPLNLTEKDTNTLYLDHQENEYRTRNKSGKLAQTGYFPEIFAGYFNQHINRVSGFDGWQVGIHIPLWFFPEKARAEEARLNTEMAMHELQYRKNLFYMNLQNQLTETGQLKSRLDYFHRHALKSAGLLIHTINARYEHEQIEFYEYLEGMRSAYHIKLQYLETVNRYNQSVIMLDQYLH